MEERKNVALATEMIGDLQQKIACITLELESLAQDADRAMFPLSELMEITDKEPTNEKEILYFAKNQRRIYGYADIAYDYVGKISSRLMDLIVRVQNESEEQGGLQ